MMITVSAQPRSLETSLLLFGCDFGEFGTFEGYVRHEPFDIENEPDDGVLHWRR